MPYRPAGYYARARNSAAHKKSRATGRAASRPRPKPSPPCRGSAAPRRRHRRLCYGERSPILTATSSACSRATSASPAIRPSARSNTVGAGRHAGRSGAGPGHGRHTQGLMDLGATLCTRGKPACDKCPVADTCVARREGRQAELPTPARKAVPERETAMLVQWNGAYRCAAGPEPGIWAACGACPPDAAGDPGASRALGLERRPSALAAFSHTFTHYRLHIRPWWVEVPAIPARRPGHWAWNRNGTARWPRSRIPSRTTGCISGRGGWKCARPRCARRPAVALGAGR